MVEASRKWRQETSARLDAMSVEARLEYLEGFRKASKTSDPPPQSPSATKLWDIVDRNAGQMLKTVPNWITR